VTGYFEDHGLPLVQLKEQRRDLVVALIGRHPGPVSKEQRRNCCDSTDHCSRGSGHRRSRRRALPDFSESLPRQAQPPEALAVPAVKRKTRRVEPAGSI
jgi:hypothetical protein